MVHALSSTLRSFTAIGVALAAIVLGACRASKSPSSAINTNASAGASTIAVTACTSAGNVKRDVVASLSVGVTPTPSPGAPVTIYVEGETTKSITRDSTDQLHRYELPRGLYDVRVSIPGFNTATSRVTLTAGCHAELTATLRPRPVKGR